MSHKLQHLNPTENPYQDPIETLKIEHHATLQRLEMIERSLQYLESVPSRSATKRCRVEQTRLRDYVRELTREVALHFLVEEEALFPILAEYIGEEHGPIDLMLQEHSNIKSCLSTLNALLGDLCHLSCFEWDALLKTVAVSGYKAIDLLRLHISKENQILFKICEVSLSESEKFLVSKKIHSIEAK